MYYLLALLVLFGSTTGDGNFYFDKTHVAVDEAPFARASFVITRTGAMTGQVTLTCKVSVTSVTTLNVGLVSTNDNFMSSHAQRCDLR